MNKTELKVFSNDQARVTQLNHCINKQFEGRPYIIVWVQDNVIPRTFRVPTKLKITRALIIFEGLPVSLKSLALWRQWAIDRGAMYVSVDFVCGDICDSDIQAVIDKHCKDWADPLPIREDPFLKTGEYIEFPSDENGKDDPDLLTMMFGSMGELVTRVELIRKRFYKVVSISDKQKEYLQQLDILIENKDQNRRGETPSLGIENLMDHLPRLLLMGDTGTGKTLIARYLQEAKDKRPPRIVIPEYLNKEDMFEYDLFGYVHGAYTGGSMIGSHGILLENVGGVIFIDEIGEANEIIQAKLLAYLDDYRVRPRGWKGTPFYCPTLIVAATNRDLEELAKRGKFRRDLLARFTDVETIPPLNQRLESLPFILDCLLQRDSINQNKAIQELGNDTYKKLCAHDFKRGNFRELEDILRNACINAQKDGRDYICSIDLRI